MDLVTTTLHDNTTTQTTTLDEAAPAAARSMRHWPARLQLGFSLRDGERSILATRAHEGPILVQRSLYPEGPRVCHVVVLHPPSGIAGGDTIDIDIHVQDGAHATLTTPGATRWYKANGRHARQTVRLSVAAGAKLDWLPLENIYFEQANATSRTEINLHPDAMAIGWELAQLGSINNDPHWDHGRARTEIELKIDDQLIWVEQGTVAAQDPIRSSVAGLANLPVYGTLWCFGARLEPLEQEALTDMMPWQPELRAGSTMLPYADGKALYLVRGMGLHAEDTRHLLMRVWQHLRHHALGIPGVPLRLWNT